ncbi:hypothetical protein CR983_00230 [Candidatus Saccharibacteria bacterium]|nr:MAG: hypothetical protein CR983_00230 [Candidatus Saccharibacteria bacterium]
MKNMYRGLTILELLVIVTVIAILASVSFITYNGVQRRASESVVLAALKQSAESLNVFYSRNNDYPPNLAGTDYIPPEGAVLTLYTNAPTVRVHSSLNTAQNAQLFINACNANMPVVSGSTTYNTVCYYDGSNIHIKGEGSSGVSFSGPNISESDIALNCGAACNSATGAIKSAFTAQGGTYPITVPNGVVPIPDPELSDPGSATDFCLESRSTKHPDVVYHTIHNEDKIEMLEGACPANPQLHYP